MKEDPLVALGQPQRFANLGCLVPVEISQSYDGPLGVREVGERLAEGRNGAGAGALEVLYFGPTMVVEADDVRMSFAGANAAIRAAPSGS